MIRLDNIGKQNGKRLIFVEASAALQKGEKIGLVGPNGAGKTRKSQTKAWCWSIAAPPSAISARTSGKCRAGARSPR